MKTIPTLPDDPAASLPDIFEHFRELTGGRGQRAGICKGLLHLAEATPFPNRRWFSVAEIANAHARDPNTLVLNSEKHTGIVELLRDAIVKREFVDERGRLQVMNLHSDPRISFRFDSDAARNADWFQKSTELL